jgi:hypothetical protein
MQMMQDVHTFVKERKPKIIKPVMPKSKSNNRRAVDIDCRRAIETRSRQMSFHNDRDAMLCEILRRQPRAIRIPAELYQFAQETVRQRFSIEPGSHLCGFPGFQYNAGKP